MMSEDNTLDKPSYYLTNADEIMKIHEGLREISYFMGIIDKNCDEVKAIVTRLSEKYGLSKRDVRQLASDFVLKKDFTEEPTTADLQKRLIQHLGDEPQ